MARRSATLGEALDRAEPSEDRPRDYGALTLVEPEAERPLLVDIDAIDVIDRLRTVETEAVEVLAQAVRDNDGRLESPIILRPRREMEKNGRWGREEKGRFVLIAGAHRLAAAKTLGWGRIPAFVRDVPPDQALIIEIDENLIRKELTPLDRAVCIGKRKEVYERLHPHAGHGGDRKSEAFKNQDENLASCSFTEEAAGLLKLSERAIQRAVRIQTGLHPSVIELITGTPLAGKEGALYRLAGFEDAEAQKESAERLLKHRETKAGQRRRRGPPPDGGYERLFTAWQKASSHARQKFVATFIKSDQAGTGGNNDA